MGTIAERGVMECVLGWGGGVSVSSKPPEGRGHHWDAGTKELAGVCPFFLSFFPWLF